MRLHGDLNNVFCRLPGTTAEYKKGWVERLPGRRPWLGPETGDTSLMNTTRDTAKKASVEMRRL